MGAVVDSVVVGVEGGEVEAGMMMMETGGRGVGGLEELWCLRGLGEG